MTVTIEVTSTDIAQATTWADLHITETLGEPDHLTVAAVGFPVDPGVTQPVIDVFDTDNYYYALVKLDTDILFSGLLRKIGLSKATKGALQYVLNGDSWEFLAPKRLVGAPAGDQYIIQGDDAADQLPTAVAVDPSASGSPIPASVKALWTAYWNSPWPIDLDTFVTDVLPTGTSVDDITWSGSDLAGATSDLAAYGSAAALWWLANDSPLDLWVAGHPSPKLALHWCALVMPDDGDTGDELLAGFPSADQPSVIAPYAIDNDAPDGVTSILPLSIELEIDHNDRDDATYVRGATGFTQEILPAPVGNTSPYVVGLVVEGGTGWVGSPGGIWGAAYTDAPAAILPSQRDAFGNAYLASRSTPRITGTIRVGGGYDGWHKGQAVMVTDEDYALAGRWLLIRGVDAIQKTPQGVFEYTLTVGDTLTASLGFALRQQRLKEARKEIDPATQFIPYVGDLLLAPGNTAPVTMQLASAAGKAMPVKGVSAVWGLLIDGVDVDPADTGGLFWLSDMVTTTDEAGQITATLNSSTSATAADAAAPWAKIA